MTRKIAIVTGASKGIGREIAKELAYNDYQVVANYYKSEEKAQELKKELERNNIDIDIIKADVSNREDVKRMVKCVLDKYKKIDILINNAGIDQIKLFQDITDSDWNDIINANLYSVFCTTQETVKNMINNQQGCIINISSVYGEKGGSGESIYSATKAGINGLTKALAKELGPSGIRVNAIAPGVIDTDMNHFLTEKDKEQIKENSSLYKIGKPLDIARCVKWLIEDEFTTGQIISIDGGWQA